MSTTKISGNEYALTHGLLYKLEASVIYSKCSAVIRVTVPFEDMGKVDTQYLTPFYNHDNGNDYLCKLYDINREILKQVFLNTYKQY